MGVGLMEADGMEADKGEGEERGGSIMEGRIDEIRSTKVMGSIEGRWEVWWR